MIKMMFQPPFEPTEIEAIAIVNMSYMFMDFITMIILILFMLYSFKKIRVYTISIVIYGFSMIIGMQMLGHSHTHLSPMLEIFFLVLQTSLFVIQSLDLREEN